MTFTCTLTSVLSVLLSFWQLLPENIARKLVCGVTMGVTFFLYRDSVKAELMTSSRHPNNHLIIIYYVGHRVTCSPTDKIQKINTRRLGCWTWSLDRGQNQNQALTASWSPPLAQQHPGRPCSVRRWQGEPSWSQFSAWRWLHRGPAASRSRLQQETRHQSQTKVLAPRTQTNRNSTRNYIWFYLRNCKKWTYEWERVNTTAPHCSSWYFLYFLIRRWFWSRVLGSDVCSFLPAGCGMWWRI